jgi:hypothetical protein
MSSVRLATIALAAALLLLGLFNAWRSHIIGIPLVLVVLGIAGLAAGWMLTAAARDPPSANTGLLILLLGSAFIVIGLIGWFLR